MITPPTESIHDPNVLPVLRELFHQHPTTLTSTAEALSDVLYEFRYLPYRPEPFEVEVAREALLVDGEVLA